ncbi:MAG TPA: ATP-binding cassette domain-containing protein [Terriglobales bacterium]|jgi:phospholipid/cholesterol/gamma-HCH transport system ATP-binding protein|nr:ATP-binding cassette domain-containing protein [Terriglobales bacterium]
MSTISAARDLDARRTADSDQKIIVFDDVAIGFEEKKVLDGVSFELTRGETKILFGVAGVGKSTLLKLVLGLEKPDRGHIYVLGQDVTAMREQDLFDLRRKIGMVFQESALFDSLTVQENVGYRLYEEQLPEEEIRRRAEEALRFVELGHTLDMFPAALSGGMRRRVAIARAIITQPEVLLYDSPTGGLDPITSTRIIELVVKQRDFYKTSALLVTHRLQDGFTMATHYFDPQRNQMRPLAENPSVDVRTTFVILREGKVIFNGTAKEMGASQDEYIKEYIA